MDGNSKDRTIKIIRSNKGKIKLIKNYDKGLYHAMNVGIKNASGEIIGILSSDYYIIKIHSKLLINILINTII